MVHQGSITALTNAQGQIVESFTYDRAYGIITEHTQSEETLNPYAYTGRELAGHEARGIDGTLCDLYYYRARYYDPTTGTFISEDPIGFLSGDFNWYRYVGNDPVNWVDPSGLYSWSEFGYDATKNVAGVCDSLTFGFSGWVGKKINAYRYGDAVANQTNEAIENSLGERGTDVAMLATGVGGLAKGGFKGGKALWKNRKAIAGAFKAAQKAMKPAEKQIAKKCEAVKKKQTGIKIHKPENKLPNKELDKLNKKIASDEQMAKVNSGNGRRIAGKGAKKPLRDSPRLAAQHGGKAEDWSKVRSDSYTRLDGTTQEIHAYQNKEIGKIVEHKTKIQGTPK